MTHAYELARYKPKTHGEMVYTTIAPPPSPDPYEEPLGYTWDAVPPYAVIAYFGMDTVGGYTPVILLALEEIPDLQCYAPINSIDRGLYFFTYAIERDGLVHAPIFSTLRKAQIYYMHRVMERINALDSERRMLEEALTRAHAELELMPEVEPPAPFLPPRLLSSGPPEAD